MPRKTDKRLPGHSYSRNEFETDWEESWYERESIPEDYITYDHSIYYRGEWNEETGKWKIWSKERIIAVWPTFFTRWSDWYASEDEIPEKYTDYSYMDTDVGDFKDHSRWQTESATLYRYSKR